MNRFCQPWSWIATMNHSKAVSRITWPGESTLKWFNQSYLKCHFGRTSSSIHPTTKCLDLTFVMWIHALLATAKRKMSFLLLNGWTTGLVGHLIKTRGVSDKSSQLSRWDRMFPLIIICWTQRSYKFFKGIAPDSQHRSAPCGLRALENTASKFKFLNTNEFSASQSCQLPASQKNHARGCFYHAFLKPNVCHLGQEPQLKRLHHIWHCLFVSPMLPSVADRRLAPTPSENCLKAFFVGASLAAAAWASGSERNASAALISASFWVLATTLV